MERLVTLLFFFVIWCNGQNHHLSPSLQPITPQSHSFVQAKNDDPIPAVLRESKPKVGKKLPDTPVGEPNDLKFSSNPESGFDRRRSVTLNPLYQRTIPFTSQSSTVEPTVASNGSNWFYTVNWQAGMIICEIIFGDKK